MEIPYVFVDAPARLHTLRPRAGTELLPTDRLASRSRLDTSALQFTLDDIESHLKREHGERRPTNDRGSRQDQKGRHLNLSIVAFAANHQQTRKGAEIRASRSGFCYFITSPSHA
jgi:predicted Zn-dependent protease